MRTIMRTVILALAAAIAVAAITLLIIFKFLLPPTETRQTSPAAYTIGEWEGKVAVFEGEDSYPMQILDTDVAGLPTEQRAKVQAGIRVERGEDLYLILEDYTN